MKTLLPLTFLLVSLSALTQVEPFVGSVVYAAANDDRGFVEPPLPDRVIIHSAPGFHRYEEAIGDDRRVVIYDLARGEQYTLVTLLGERIAILAPMESPAVLSSADAVENDALPICGWLAKSTTVNNSSVVYTPRWLSNHPMLPQCQGLVLEFTYPKSSLRLRAKEVKTESPNPEVFAIPAGYEVVTAEQLIELFGIDGD